MFNMVCKGKLINKALYTTLMVVITLQLLSTLERQVFDFLGYMWAPIIANTVQIICCILGIFGTYQMKAQFVVVYSTWSLMWLGWNIFVICLYLEVGVLNRNRDLFILTIGTKNKSWWLEHGIGCKITNDTWMSENPVKTSRLIPPEEAVEGCLLDYYYVEVIHAGVQCLLALIGFTSSCVSISAFKEEEESSAKDRSGKPSSSANDELEFVKMYSNSSPSRRRYQSNDNMTLSYDNPATEFPTLDRPPSYETSMRESTTVNDHYGADRRSVRSVRSVRSKASNKSKTKNERREELPWVQITPSANSIDQPFRHYP
ncbi:sodium/potassium-transporting ATPase subunit beta-1-interacting protein 3 isoform X4 [Magallana gigas]|uniref:sodium/potassium-transporting ATPase subunit beta-1-interacting protein 3 isoform X4 n=1 Tax=Magallana gigas TaxID=29159 RepID=UPI0005C369D7|nr:sodium/potassium-transporting ATPase subunit beta-1-interacting protein 3 isoform X5 [Crassostrea gigas]|eukprot:XP_011431591.1 PREDICTED: sodium/potassium-transporting ATPase subunit beta-1-interacting protein 3 isoform X3 [Crassostrea gigas]